MEKGILWTLHSVNRASWHTYVRKTKKMHTFPINLFHFTYPQHVSNKSFLAYYAWPRTPSTKVTRKERNQWRQHVHRATRPRSYAIDKVWEAVTSRCLGNGRSDASCKQYSGVSASYKQFSVSASYKQYVSDECTYNIQSRQKHNMLSFLHAACLKLLFFFNVNFKTLSSLIMSAFVGVWTL